MNTRNEYLNMNETRGKMRGKLFGFCHAMLNRQGPEAKQTGSTCGGLMHDMEYSRQKRNKADNKQGFCHC